ncbi:MAG: glutamine synthetase III [Deltaproteobacteria bacterium]|jgi:glutamine synthetase|nr:glutamine synthetase III [Deltaproteobacteria bacterium]
MTAPNTRNAVRTKLAANPPALPVFDNPPTSELFGRDIFSHKLMRERLPKSVYERLQATIENDNPISPSDADVIASAMKDWAIERGATHFTHWFQPLTGVTAEKHDAFLTPTSSGDIVNEFSGKMLIKGEPDASSFPSGGIRSTFEARGYTAWDPTSPVFLLKSGNRLTLYVPTIFLSHTGEALDAKTPLLRSQEAVSRQAIRILRFFGNDRVTRVRAMVGPEQEYFLIDRRLYSLRPDLIMAGRTVVGAPAPKGQELEDHYFGAISPKILAFMTEVENRLWALGIPARTRHNEVAPAQFELAPLYEPINLAVDHNMLVLKIMRDTATEFGLACLLHEKPFIGINGSGKHNNWSLCDSEGHNLTDPGPTPWNNPQFMVFLAAVLRAVHKYSIPLRIGVTGAGNDHRLGANEAPPAILSVFLGDQLADVIKAYSEGKTDAETWRGGAMTPGISALAPVARDITDRNRTSPFAFTGNKFEFRAVGSSQSIAPPNIALNASVACALDDIATELEKTAASGLDRLQACRQVLTKFFEEHLPVVFNGNNYAPEWEEEAEKRGLWNLKDSVTALSHYTDPEVKDVFTRHGILNEREIEARQDVLLENYIRVVHVETKLVQTIGRSTILPVALDALKKAADLVNATLNLPKPADAPVKPEELNYQRLYTHTSKLISLLDELDATHVKLDASEGVLLRAEGARDELLPLLLKIRVEIDALELLIDDGSWPLPKYGEMLWQ